MGQAIQTICMKNFFVITTVILFIISIILASLLYRENKRYVSEIESRHNLALYESLHHLELIYESLLNIGPGSSLEELHRYLTETWREANLAKIYLSHLPTSGYGLRKGKEVFE